MSFDHHLAGYFCSGKQTQCIQVKLVIRQYHFHSFPRYSSFINISIKFTVFIFQYMLIKSSMNYNSPFFLSPAISYFDLYTVLSNKHVQYFVCFGFFPHSVWAGGAWKKCVVEVLCFSSRASYWISFKFY